MQNRNSKVGLLMKKEQKLDQQNNSDSDADNSQVSPLAQNRLLSAAFSVEGNRLIAEFMKINVTDFVWNEHLGLVHCDEHGDFQIDEDLQYYSPNSSWNDLMPVVEKIEGFGFTFIIDGLSAYCYEKGKIMEGKSGIAKTKIEAVWIAVIKFIKWQNDNVDVGSR